MTAVARPGSLRFDQLLRDDAIVNTVNERTEVSVGDNLDEQVPYDLVLVALLAHQVGTVLPTLKRSVARAFLFMFNNFEPETIVDALGAERCSFGMPFIQAHLAEDGRFTAKIGAGGQKSKIGSAHWVGVFNSAGLPAAVVEPNMLLWLRCHAPVGRRWKASAWPECDAEAELRGSNPWSSSVAPRRASS